MILSIIKASLILMFILLTLILITISAFGAYAIYLIARTLKDEITQIDKIQNMHNLVKKS